MGSDAAVEDDKGNPVLLDEIKPIKKMDRLE